MEKRYIPGTEFGEASSQPLKKFRYPMYAGLFLLISGLILLFYSARSRMVGALVLVVSILLLVFSIRKFLAALNRSHLLGQSAGKTYVLLKETTLCGASFSNADLEAGSQEFELSYGEIRSVQAKTMDFSAADYTTLTIETDNARYCTAIDNSEEAAREIEKRMASPSPQ